MYPDTQLSIYIHIPFCQTKCPYCDFNSYETSREEIRIREKTYIAALVKELAFQAQKYKLSGKIIKSIFFGGGTPSLLSGDAIRTLLDAMREHFDIAKDVEITLEANPRSIQEEIPEEKLGSFYQAGVNRLSFGAQSFLQDKLDFLGRWHTPEDTESSIEMARQVGFSNISLDLMFGIKGETLSGWESELRQAVRLSTTHISTYMLTMEPGTVFGKRTKKGEVFVTEDDAFVQLYRASQQILEASGYTQYEISNFSKPEMICKHNLVYWKGGEYLGLGAGAHSYIRDTYSYGVRWSNTPSPQVYVRRILNENNAEQIHDVLTKEKVLLEKISLGLRLREGLSINDTEIEALIERKVVQHIIDAGLLELENEHMRIPVSKFHFADGVVSEICDVL
jgi:oxygen-independent coproporphyrinogen III oxidase